MTVIEIIRELSKFDPALEVRFRCHMTNDELHEYASWDDSLNDYFALRKENTFEVCREFDSIKFAHRPVLEINLEY